MQSTDKVSAIPGDLKWSVGQFAQVILSVEIEAKKRSNC